MFSSLNRRVLAVFAVFFGPAALCAFTIGLTHLPCYASVCPEDYFPYETRYHLGVFYVMLMLVGFALYLRSSSHFVYVLSGRRFSAELPFIRKRLTFGGVTTTLVITAITLATTALWLPSHWSYWGERADPLDWNSAKIRLTITGVTGHYADILLGLLVIPVSRNNLVGRAFGLHQSTLLFAHKVVAYLFSLAVLAHGIAYAMYALDSSSNGDKGKEEAFGTGNPTMTLDESESRNYWFSTTTYNGVAVFLFIILITITASAFIRRRNYNLFYYCHILCSICIFIGASIHASTDFYLLLPGLCLWIADWAWRLFYGSAGGLHKATSVKLDNAGEGWYRVSFPSLLSQGEGNRETSGASDEVAMASFNPLQSYYLNIPSISRIQNHAFTAAIPGSDKAGPVFLFQRAQGKASKKTDKEWTWKLGALVPRAGDSADINVRLEGPYEPRDAGFEQASDIVCIVGGTGVTGAYSLASWWLNMKAALRNREAASVKEWLELESIALSVPNLTLIVNISSEEGRLNSKEQIQRALSLCSTSDADNMMSDTRLMAGRQAWVYSSGPDGLIRSTEKACVEIRHEIGANKSKYTVQGIDWYMAKWEV